MESKKCLKCEQIKDLNINNFYFSKNTNKWRSRCKICLKEEANEYRAKNKDVIKKRNKLNPKTKEHEKKYRINNKNKINKQKKEWRKKNPEKVQAARLREKETQKLYKIKNKDKIKLKNKEYYDKPENKQKLRDWWQKNKEKKYSQNKEWHKNNPEKSKIIRQRKNKKRKYNSNFRFRQSITRSINKKLKVIGASKNNESSFKNLPYTFQELKTYIESQFEPWMTWDNHGRYNPKTWDDDNQSTWTWQLDHIKPHSEFKYNSIDDQSFKDCWALSNLRPYSAKQNILDGSTRIRHEDII